MSQNVVLGLGSNTFYDSLSPVDLLKKACEMLSDKLQEIKLSSIYRTKAMYVTDQSDFYNMVVCGKYEGDARSLLNDIHEVENRLGRDRSKEIRFGPRSLDVDIEVFGNMTISEDDLIIPHPRVMERAFVLVPLIELIDKKYLILENESLYRSALESVGLQGVSFYGHC